MSKELIEALEDKVSEQEATIRELQIELMRVTEERDALKKKLEDLQPKEKSFAERVTESVTQVVNLVNQGTANPKDVYPPGRYCGD
jgi:hypothetical protein